MKTTGNLISSTAELTACVKNGKYNLNCRNTSLMIDTNRNTTSIINDSDRIILLDRYIDLCTISSQCFVYGIIHYLIYEMMKTTDRGTAYIHTGSFSNCFQSLQNLDLICSIFIVHFCSHIFPLFYKNFTSDCVFI